MDVRLWPPSMIRMRWPLARFQQCMGKVIIALRWHHAAPSQVKAAPFWVKLVGDEKDQTVLSSWVRSLADAGPILGRVDGKPRITLICAEAIMKRSPNSHLKHVPIYPGVFFCFVYFVFKDVRVIFNHCPFFIRKIFLIPTVKVCIDLYKQWVCNPSVFAILKGIVPCASSLGCRWLCKESFLLWRGNTQDIEAPLMRAKRFSLEQFLLPFLQNQTTRRKRQKQLNYFSNSLPTPVFFPFKCILAAVPGHLENINNHLRSQMPSHWEFPNWVTLQSAAQNRTQSPACSAHGYRHSHRRQGFRRGGVLLREISVLPSLQSPICWHFSLILKDMWPASVCEELFVEV